MSETHTPGPWFAREDGCIAVGDKPISQTQKWNLLKVISPWVENAWDGDPEALANARLIAAAPAMLEALRPLAECEIPESDTPLPDSDSARYFMTMGEIRAARAAIALATGETQ